ncbi:hypothetical protein MC69_011615 [Aeromonas hydrophila]|nr:hypothetical protein MC69_011615 [Aeromonas hydrophila]
MAILLVCMLLRQGLDSPKCDLKMESIGLYMNGTLVKWSKGMSWVMMIWLLMEMKYFRLYTQ